MRADACLNCGRALPRDPDAECVCGMCRVCAWRPAEVKGRCATDASYRRRHGIDRPEELVVAHARQVDAGKRPSRLSPRKRSPAATERRVPERAGWLALMREIDLTA